MQCVGCRVIPWPPSLWGWASHSVHDFISGFGISWPVLLHDAARLTTGCWFLSDGGGLEQCIRISSLAGLTYYTYGQFLSDGASSELEQYYANVLVTVCASLNAVHLTRWKTCLFHLCDSARAWVRHARRISRNKFRSYLDQNLILECLSLTSDYVQMCSPCSYSIRLLLFTRCPVYVSWICSYYSHISM